MRISHQQLAKEATASGCRLEILEKVFHLFNLLDGFQSHPFLKDRVAVGIPQLARMRERDPNETTLAMTVLSGVLVAHALCLILMRYRN